MIETKDVIIIGAGLNGAATAWFLARQGIRNILILDANLPGSGASGASVGLLRTHYDNRPETELAVKSMPYFRNWSDMIGDDCGWRQIGFYRFIEPHEIENMKINVEVQRSMGETVEILDAKQVKDQVPGFLTDDIGAVVYEPNMGTASNSCATYSMLRQSGAQVRPFTTVLSIDTQNGVVCGVTTDRGRISAPIVVLASGTSCRDLAATCGVDLPVVAREIRVAEILLPEPLRQIGSYMDPMTDSWLSPREQGRAIISVPNARAGEPIDPKDYSADFSRSDAEAGLDPVQRRLPGIANAPVLRWWSKPECFAPDGKPILGGVDGLDGLYLNVATAGKGHKIAPAVGLALSELITQRTSPTADLTPFNLARFQNEPKPWSESQYGKRVIG